MENRYRQSNPFFPHPCTYSRQSWWLFPFPGGILIHKRAVLSSEQLPLAKGRCLTLKLTPLTTLGSGGWQRDTKGQPPVMQFTCQRSRMDQAEARLQLTSHPCVGFSLFSILLPWLSHRFLLSAPHPRKSQGSKSLPQAPLPGNLN